MASPLYHAIYTYEGRGDNSTPASAVRQRKVSGIYAIYVRTYEPDERRESEVSKNGREKWYLVDGKDRADR